LSPDEQEHITHHVADCPACRETLSALRTGKFLGPIPPPPDDLGLPHIPGYEPLAELGRGGMGVVYKALQVALNRVVAVKMILEGGDASPELRQRFRAEAEAAARLAHPNVVQVYEVGEHAGRTFLALEFVAGNSLARKLGGKPVSAAEAAALVEPLARAVQHAHERGVVHRDLKPANVLLSVGQAFQPDSSKDVRLESLTYVPKITDFGLARRQQPESGQTHATIPGELLGTPVYMAPEQTWADSQDVGERTDVYGLGAILYQMLTGRVPFEGANLIETVLKVRNQPVALPRKLNPAVDRRLESVCLKCLEKKPRWRYRKVQGIVEDLGRFAGRKAPRAHSVPARVNRTLRRHPYTAWAILLLALTAVVFPTVDHIRAPEREVEHMVRALKRDETVPLFHPTGEPRWKRWLRGNRLMRIMPDGTCYMESQGFGFLELLPDPAHPYFCFSVEVRHDSSHSRFLKEGQVGIFLGHSAYHADAPLHFLYSASFNTQAIGGEGQVRLTVLALKGEKSQKGQPLVLPPFQYGDRERWRKLVVEKLPGGIRVRFWEDADRLAKALAFGFVSNEQLRPHEIFPLQELKLLDTFPDFPTGTSLGLFMYDSAASFRNATIKHLHPPLASFNEGEQP
jgi:serine/threonine protein kinase